MSSGRGGAIPSNVRKMIQTIKEMSGGHTDDEIYAMLKDCAMDPNETAQNLLNQDTFHEVKRRRDRKKENQTNREIADPRWRSGPPGRGGRGGRGNYSPRYSAQDAGGGRNMSSVKENGVNQASDKAGSTSSPPASLGAKRKDDRSSVTVIANGPIGVLSGGNGNAYTSVVLPGSGTKQTETSTQTQTCNGGSKRSSLTSEVKDESRSHATFSGVSSSSLDPVLLPSNDTRGSAGVGAIRREVGSQRSVGEPNLNISADHKPYAGKIGGKSHGAGKYQAEDSLQLPSLNHGNSSSSRPSSNYGSRSQQSVGSQKVGPNKEWKPKPTNTSTVQGPKTPAAAESPIISAETSAHTQPIEMITDSGEATSNLEKELESLHVRDAQHVIIPNHIHVPDAVRTGLSFGSFDAAFTLPPKRSNESESENSKSVSEPDQRNEVTVERQATSQDTLTPAEEAEYLHNSQSPKKEVNLSSGDVHVPPSSVPDFTDSKETPSAPQHSSAHNTSVGYNFGLVPPMLGNPIGPLEVSENQACDVSRAPGFAVPPVDPSSFYAQFYRSGADNDGRVSPFPAHGVASKYNGNVAVLSPPTSQCPVEGGNSMVFSTAAQAPLATQAAGLIPNSIAVTQQPIPIFRQPAGVHLPHYPPNFIPYGHYFSPFYVPPPAMHQFLGNNAFPQQAQAGSMYPAPPAAAAAPTAVKFPLSQYKPGSNAGISAHMGVGGGYGPYGASPGGFNHSSSSTVGNATINEDLAASQFKESMYITGQQSEGSAVWFPAPGRDMTSMPANSFYNLPPQGQHVTFAPAQAGQGTYAGIYHPGQAVTAANVHPLLQQSQAMPGAVDMVGATANMYQPQHPQMNWPSNY